ncbi:MAG: RecX, partial [uncultured Nocardioides sp.]
GRRPRGRPGGRRPQDPARPAHRSGPDPAPAGGEARAEERAGGAGHPAPRPVRGGRARRRRGLRPRVGPAAQHRPWARPACAGARAAAQGHRRRRGPGGARGARRRRRAGDRTRAGAPQAAVGAGARPRQGHPSPGRHAGAQGPLARRGLRRREGGARAV